MPALNSDSRFLPRARQFHGVQQFAHPAARRLFIQAEHTPLKEEKLVRVERVEQAERFRHHAHAPFQRHGAIVERLAQNPDLARVGVEQAGQAANGGAFPGAVRPQETEHGSPRHGQGEVFDGERLPILLG